MDKIYSTILVLLFIQATAFCANQMPEDECNAKITNETCVIISSCPYAVKLIKENAKNVAKLKNCGYDRNDPKICCPTNPISYNNTEEIATNRPKQSSSSKQDVEVNSSFHTTRKPDTIFPNKMICGKYVGVDNRIFNGSIAMINEHPWLARIRYKNGDEDVFGCAAALITDRFLLTAAHCIVKNIPNGIRLGEWNTETESDCYEGICNNITIDVDIKNITVHPKFNNLNGADGDIALIELKEAVTFTNFIQPICLPTSNYVTLQDYSKDSEYWTAGWGLTEFGSPSVVKRQIQLSAAPIEICRNFYALKSESEPNIICAGGSNRKDTCQGDSGGPLIKFVSENYEANWYMFGITSFGSRKCGSEGVPGLYTRVTKFMDWIRAVVTK